MRPCSSAFTSAEGALRLADLALQGLGGLGETEERGLAPALHVEPQAVLGLGEPAQLGLELREAQGRHHQGEAHQEGRRQGRNHRGRHAARVARGTAGAGP